MLRAALLGLFVTGLTLLAQPELRPTQTLKGFTGTIFNVAYSPDGKVLATAGKDRKVRLFNPLTGVEVRALEGHTDDIYRVLFSPDGKLLASAAGDRTVRLWDPATGQLVHKLSGSGTMYNLAFRPDGKVLAGCASDGHVHVWSLDDGKVLRAWKAHADRALGLAFHPDGQTLASAASAGGTGGSGEVILWDAVTWTEVRRMPSAKGIMAIAFSPRGTTLAGGAADKTVRLWEVATGIEVLKLDGHGEHAYFVAFNGDGTRLASGGGNWNGDKPGEVIVWDMVRGKQLASFGGYTQPIWSVAYHPNGGEVASASGKWNGTGNPGEVRLWSLTHLKAEPFPAATPDLVTGWWADLHGDDPSRAYRAGWQLAHAGTLTLPLMLEKVRPPRTVSAEQIAKWVADLDHDDYDIRETALADLEKLGAQVRGAIVKATESPAPERRRRARYLLERIADVVLSAAEVHALRELDVLARIGPTARTLVERYLSNPEGSPVGGEARRVLRGLGK